MHTVTKISANTTAATPASVTAPCAERLVLHISAINAFVSASSDHKGCTLTTCLAAVGCHANVMLAVLQLASVEWHHKAVLKRGWEGNFIFVRADCNPALYWWLHIDHGDARLIRQSSSGQVL